MIIHNDFLSNESDIPTPFSAVVSLNSIAHELPLCRKILKLFSSEFADQLSTKPVMGVYECIGQDYAFRAGAQWSSNLAIQLKAKLTMDEAIAFYDQLLETVTTIAGVLGKPHSFEVKLVAAVCCQSQAACN